MNPEISCGIVRTMEVLGGKWTILIVRDLLEGPRRFSELESSLLGISPRTLAARLKELEDDDILNRDCSTGHPIYSLTQRGRMLDNILQAMRDWGNTTTSAEKVIS